LTFIQTCKLPTVNDCFFCLDADGNNPNIPLLLPFTDGDEYAHPFSSLPAMRN
jgi:hypothetical protein